MKREASRQGKAKKVLGAAALAALAAIAVWIASFVPNADWYGTFHAAGRGLFRGESPYEQPLFVNPPWAAALLVPFVLFPPAIARGLVLVTSVAGLIYFAWRMHAPKFAVVAFLLSPTVIAVMLAANLDAYASLGMFLPPAGGLFLLLIKPQIGLGPAAFFALDAWRTRGIGGVLRVFLPVSAAALGSALLFPVWVERILHMPAGIWNRSMFPFGIPIGLAVLWFAVRRRNAFLALAASPFLTPYISFPTYAIVQLGLMHPDVERVVRRDILQVTLAVILWVLMLALRL